MIPFEQHLASNLDSAMSEGSRFFEGRGAVQSALRRVSQRLDELQIPYAVAGGMALFAHGYRRFTEDVDIVVSRDSLRRIHDELEGRGYLPPFAGSKQLRDTQDKVKVEFLITGDYPGDGRPKPVAFPDPALVAQEIDGIRYVNLPTLVELKIASGISGAARLKDLADVQELIKVLKLPESLAEQLSPYVQAKYRELWQAVESARNLAEE